MSRPPAHAKINLALVVGPPRDDGKHEVATVLQRIDLADRIELERRRRSASTASPGTRSSPARSSARRERGRRAALARRGSRSRFRSPRGSAAAAPTPRPRSGSRTRRCRAASAGRACTSSPRGLGADVPFFLAGPAARPGDGTSSRRSSSRRTTGRLLLLPDGAAKESTGAVYARFDARDGAPGFDERRAALLDGARRVNGARPRRAPAERPRHLAARRRRCAPRRLPRRRHRRRPARLRALRPPPRRGRRADARFGAAGGAGSPRRVVRLTPCRARRSRTRRSSAAPAVG